MTGERLPLERADVLPLEMGLDWNNEVLHVTRRLGIMTLYFSAVGRLISEMTGRYRHEDHLECNQGIKLSST